ncbi:hypothetical protein [Mucilaginibacter aquatilis]|uniref:Uncharacterized protein n=1 Tax=Mucilaginibacter aquatilis TaxID=1517760 RepID=A0A6I4IDY1_9SPHI|nr:hypothetical protein [Mucilaginibacter aquatilis]MVN91569.1 hypothetical protein [Mucilaginibacter aquatilis]
MKHLQRFANYILLIFWAVCSLIYFTLDIWLDLYTYKDSAKVAWYMGIAVMPLVAYTIYLGKEIFFSKWYYGIILTISTFGIYFFAAYFSLLNIDLLVSAAFGPAKKMVLPVERVERVFARKAGFVHTNVTIKYNHRLYVLEGTRTSYYYLRDKKQLRAMIGRSYTGNIYAVKLNVAPHQRYQARWLYIKDWFSRYWWLFVAFTLYILYYSFRGKYFSNAIKKSHKNQSRHFFILNRVKVILLAVFFIGMILILAAGLLL